MSQDINTKTTDGQPEQIEPQPPTIVLTISKDAMELEMLLQKPSENTRNPSFEEIMAAISEKGVLYGINEVAIQALCKNPMYNHPLLIARGTPATTGKDGSLNYLIEQTRDLRPKLREDGTVDYRDIGYIQNVTKGQPLCEIHPPEKGEDGSDVFGNSLEGKLGRESINPAGKNTEYNEDKTLLLAAVDGNAEVQRGVISVIDILRINGNVDNSTGDINFVGDVMILGDVVSGFRVTSKGNIMIKGSVEGAIIQADGDVVVGEGINGMNRGSVIAGGNLKCKYIQGCYIQADQNIFADSIMYCTMECSGNVELGGKRAALIGGRSTIAGYLASKTIGTDSHVATLITMASTGTKRNQEIGKLNDDLKNLDAENIKLVQIMTRYEDLQKQGRVDAEQSKMILSVKEKYLAQAARRAEIISMLDQIKQEQLEASQSNSYIVCKGRVHVGVQITFGPITTTIQNSFVNSRISIVDNDIKIMSL